MSFGCDNKNVDGSNERIILSSSDKPVEVKVEICPTEEYKFMQVK